MSFHILLWFFEKVFINFFRCHFLIFFEKIFNNLKGVLKFFDKKRKEIEGNKVSKCKSSGSKRLKHGDFNFELHILLWFFEKVFINFFRCHFLIFF
jgi:hypothetical protein